MLNRISPFVFPLFLIVSAGGWVANIVMLASRPEEMGMVLARVAGIFVAPLGTVLGFF